MGASKENHDSQRTSRWTEQPLARAFADSLWFSNATSSAGALGLPAAVGQLIVRNETSRSAGVLTGVNQGNEGLALVFVSFVAFCGEPGSGSVLQVGRFGCQRGNFEPGGGANGWPATRLAVGGWQRERLVICFQL